MANGLYFLNIEIFKFILCEINNDPPLEMVYAWYCLIWEMFLENG
jgi:hypothetical protein